MEGGRVRVQPWPPLLSDTKRASGIDEAVSRPCSDGIRASRSNAAPASALAPAGAAASRRSRASARRCALVSGEPRRRRRDATRDVGGGIEVASTSTGSHATGANAPGQPPSPTGPPVTRPVRARSAAAAPGPGPSPRPCPGDSAAGGHLQVTTAYPATRARARRGRERPQPDAAGPTPARSQATRSPSLRRSASTITVHGMCSRMAADLLASLDLVDASATAAASSAGRTSAA